MTEVTGNLWTYPADARVITTNGTIKRNGECVMGRGCAKEAKDKWNNVPTILGALLKEKGNIPHILREIQDGEMLVSFPVKHNWWEKADIRLIEQSAKHLMLLKALQDWPAGIVMPRPGCGNGGLRWEDVKPVIEPILDDQVHVITFR